MSPEAVPLTGEPLALDLVNTQFRGPNGVVVDVLAGTEGTRAWLARQQGRLSIAAGDVDPADLRLLRAHVAQAVNAARAGARPPASALRALTAAQLAAPRYCELTWSGGRVELQWKRIGSRANAVIAEIAEAAADLLAGATVAKIRECEAPNCQMLFVDANSRRRWCSAELCGNRVRVARYYQRRKMAQ